jgi:uncharacterized protein
VSEKQERAWRSAKGPLEDSALDLVERVLAFCRALRARGLLVTTGHAGDAVKALQHVGLRDRSLVYQALRCVLAARPEEFAVFDELFTHLFALPQDPLPDSAQPRVSALLRKPPPRTLPQPSLASWLQQGQEEPDESEAPEEAPGASDRPSLVQKDFGSFDEGELQEIERIAARLARRLAARPSRRWKAARKGPRIDLRRTLRGSLQTGA